MRFAIILMLLLAGCAGDLDRPERFTEGTLEAYAAFQAVCEDQLATFQPELAPTAFPVNVVIDTDITLAKDIGSILDGIDDWNSAVGFEAFYATITQNLDMHGMCNYAVLTTNVDLPGSWIGLTTYGKCAGDIVNVETMLTPGITNPAFYTERAVKQIAMHELGHVAGLDHEPESPDSIMYPSTGDSPRVITEKSRCLVQKAFFRSKGFQ